MLTAGFGAASVGFFDAALGLRSRTAAAAALLATAGLAGRAGDVRFLLVAVGFGLRVMCGIGAAARVASLT